MIKGTKNTQISLNNDSPNWFLSKLQETISSQNSTTKKTKMYEFKNEVQSWKQQLNQLPEGDKARQINSAIDWVIDPSGSISIANMKLCLRLIEDVSLSPRVSALSNKKYLHRLTDGTSNRAFSLAGLNHYISSKYPQLKVCYFLDVEKNPFSKTEFNELFNNNKNIWLVFQHSVNRLHKTLLGLFNINNRMEILILDSLGLSIDYNSYKTDSEEQQSSYKLYKLTEILRKHFSVDQIHHIPVSRQKDGINCGAFIFQDLETALSLIEKETPIFSDTYRDSFHPDFFKTSQDFQDPNTYGIDSTYLKDYGASNKDGSVKPGKGNCKALMVSGQILKHNLNKPSLYVEENANTDERSEGDEESCIVM